MEKDIFIKLYNDLRSIEEINKELLLRVILEFIIDLDFSEIDLRQSKFERKADGYNFDLFSNNNRKCAMFIEILNNNEVDVQLNAGGEYLYLQPIINWTDVNKLRKALSDIFFETIEEKLTNCNGKLTRATYTVCHRLDKGVERKSYSSILGNCWFWQRKEVVEKIYEPWITKQ